MKRKYQRMVQRYEIRKWWFKKKTKCIMGFNELFISLSSNKILVILVGQLRGTVWK